MKFQTFMTRSFLIVCLVSMIFLSSDPVYADCQGCCSSHGGVCCSGGVTMCCDGSPLSDTCRQKGCNACGSSTVREETVTIRLFGIDCPESNQPYGGEATDFTLNEVMGTYASLLSITTDAYGRTVAMVYIDGITLNEELVREGYAWVYEEYCDRPECSDWLELEQQARNEGRGLWSDPNPIPPWEWRQGVEGYSALEEANTRTDTLVAASDSSVWSGLVTDVVDGDTIEVVRSVSVSDGNVLYSSGGGGGGGG